MVGWLVGSGMQRKCMAVGDSKVVISMDSSCKLDKTRVHISESQSQNQFFLYIYVSILLKLTLVQ